MRILTHNVYWFQGSPPVWGRELIKDSPEIVEQLALLYRDADADVVCLQEVHRDEPALTIARALDSASVLRVSGGKLPDYGGAILTRGEATLRDATRSDTLVHERVHMRVTVAYRGSPIEIAALHLPSNRYAPDKAAGTRARITELDHALEVTPRPAIILGDLNSRPNKAVYRHLSSLGYTNAETLSGSGPPPNRIDYVWLDETIADRLVSFSVLDTGRFRRTRDDGSRFALSDHPPLLVELAE